MLTRIEAWEIAQSVAPDGLAPNIPVSRELTNGWYFPWEHIDQGEICGESQGVIVHKESGKPFVLGSALPVERDLKAYEEGFTEATYDLKILSVHDRYLTLDFLQMLGIQVVEPKRKHGTEWLIPRFLDRNELSRLLMKLPRTFRQVVIYSKAFIVHVASREQFCEFELLPIEEEHDPTDPHSLKRLCQNKPE